MPFPSTPEPAVSDLSTRLGDRRIVVILPCHNEEETIAKVVTDFVSALPDAAIFVVDNASSDGTARRAEAAGANVLGEAVKGKGNAIRRAFCAIDADVYVMADGDGTYDASRAPELIQTLIRERLDMVVGARHPGSEQVFRQGHRFGNWAFNVALKALFGSGFRDIFSGYRVFSHRYVKSFPAMSSGFEIETEMAVHAILLRMPVSEIPCHYGDRTAGSESKLRTVRDGIRIVSAIFNLLRHYRPLFFFSVVASVFFAVSLILFYPVLMEYLAAGLVPRFPTLIVSIGLAIVGVMLLVCGLVLDTTVRTQLEIRRLMYMH